MFPLVRKILIPNEISNVRSVEEILSCSNLCFDALDYVLLLNRRNVAVNRVYICDTIHNVMGRREEFIAYQVVIRLGLAFAALCSLLLLN
jgi:hypothetical protein